MNKTDFIKLISQNASMTLIDTRKFMDAFESSIKAVLSEGEDVSITGFGTFSVSDRAARTARNLITGQNMLVPAKKIVKFKAGKTLKESVQS